MSQTLFISDLHLDADYPHITKLFFSFLKTLDKKVDGLYILGDFFNYWVGDDNKTDFYLEIQTALREATQICPIYFLPGNRDVLVGKGFSKATGCTVLKDPTLINLYSVPTLLMHGDTLCIYDVSHLRYRKLMYNRLAQFIFLSLSFERRIKIAQKMRSQSRENFTTMDQKKLEIPESEVQKVMEKFGVYQLIHGHTHTHKVHSVDLKGGVGQRIVLGDWWDKGSVLICEKDPESERLTNNTLDFFHNL